MIRFRVGTATHPGRVREHNEDSLVATPRLVAVADGMGGHAAGEVASRLAVEQVAAVAGAHPNLRTEDIVSTVGLANAEILRSSAVNSEQAGMGTTLCGVAVVSVGGSDHWAVFNVGDSRVYRYAEGRLSQISVDHSEVGELVAAGRLTEQQARTYARRNVVTRSLGTDPSPQPDVWVFPPSEHERFVLCSDGLSNELDDPTVAAILAAQPDPQAAADVLVGAAVDAGGHDNVTVIVVNLLADDDAGRDGYDTAPRPHDPDAGPADGLPPDEADTVSFDADRFDGATFGRFDGRAPDDRT